MSDKIEEFKLKIIVAIENEMKRLKMSQDELGRLVGMQRNKVNNLLRGTEKSVSLKKVITLAQALNLDVDIRVKRIK